MMRNRLLEEFDAELIKHVAILFLNEKLEWNEIPRKVIIDEDSILLIYDDAVDGVVEGGYEEKDIDCVYAFGKSKKYAWIEFEHYDGLKKYILTTVPK